MVRNKIHACRNFLKKFGVEILFFCVTPVRQNLPKYVKIAQQNFFNKNYKKREMSAD